MRKILAVSVPIVIIIIAIGILAFNQNNSEQSVTVRVSYNKLIDSLPFFVALEKGFFEDEGITVKSIPQQDASLITSTLLSGQADVGLPIATSDLLLIEEKEPGQIKMFMGASETKTHRQMSILVAPDSEISSLKDLEGKKLATLPGSLGIILPKLMLKDQINPDNVTYLQMPPPDWLNALSSKQVDAVFSVEPLTTIAVTSGVGKIMLDSVMATTNYDPYVTVGFAYRTDFVEKHTDVANKIILIMKKSIDYMEAHPEEARQIMAKYTDFPEELTSQLGWSVYQDANLVQNDIQHIADSMYSEKFLTKKIDVKQIIYSP